MLEFPREPTASGIILRFPLDNCLRLAHTYPTIGGEANLKESLYFPHDYDAAHDEKIIVLRYKLKSEGYGMFWMLIEKMAQATTHCIKLDYDMLAFDLQEDKELIKKTISLCLEQELFRTHNDTIYSQRLLDHFEKRRNISIERKESGSKGGKAKASKYLANATDLPEQNVAKKERNKEINKNGSPSGLSLTWKCKWCEETDALKADVSSWGGQICVKCAETERQFAGKQ
jgi:hypothetical protein